MTTDLHATKLSPFHPADWDNREKPNAFTRRRHEAAAHIPNLPPLGQWAFKLVTSELRGYGLPASDAVKRGIEAVREPALLPTSLRPATARAVAVSIAQAYHGLHGDDPEGHSRMS